MYLKLKQKHITKIQCGYICLVWTCDKIWNQGQCSYRRTRLVQTYQPQLQNSGKISSAEWWSATWSWKRFSRNHPQCSTKDCSQEHHQHANCAGTFLYGGFADHIFWWCARACYATASPWGCFWTCSWICNSRTDFVLSLEIQNCECNSNPESRI